MSTSWMIPTHNDPLGAVRGVIQTLWEAANLECVLAPQNGSTQQTGPVIFCEPEQSAHFNPFTPLMPVNAARLIPDLLAQGQRVAAVLRPCEMRTLEGLVKLDRLNIKNLLTISVDCLGTLPADEFEWRAQRRGSPKGLAQEALQFARQGGIVPYRYRAACQICKTPEATAANVNISVLGLPVRQYLLIHTKDEQLAASIKNSNAQPVDEDLLWQHQRVAARLAERGNDTRERIFTGLVGVLPPDLDSLVEPLHGCEDCTACLEACPICASDYPRRDAEGEYMREDVMEWLVSCSGCGMCEQACPKHLPLTIIFGHIQQQLIEIL
jgi:formate dehydrogenase (coenzyme F420) beta subunit